MHTHNHAQTLTEEGLNQQQSFYIPQQNRFFWNPQAANLECESVREGVIFLSEEAPAFYFGHIIQIDWNAVRVSKTLRHASENAEGTSNLSFMNVFFVKQRKMTKAVQKKKLFLLPMLRKTLVFTSFVLVLIPCP